MNHLQPIACHWKDLGLQLGMAFVEINSIEGIPLLIPGGSAAFLQEMLHRWLNFTSPSHAPPTLAKLCGALRSPALRKNQIAHELEQHYLAQSTGLWSAAECDPWLYTARKQMHVHNSSSCSLRWDIWWHQGVHFDMHSAVEMCHFCQQPVDYRLIHRWDTSQQPGGHC